MYLDLDFCRFIFLLFSLITHHFLSNLLISDFLPKFLKHFTVFFQFTSVLFLCLCALRRGYVNYESKENITLSTRYCKFCKHYKPVRAHHCSRCKKCIKKMDHHCMWIGVCVNYDNHGDFMRFLFFSVLSTSISFSGYIYLIFKKELSNQMKVLLAYLLLYSFLVSLFCGIMFNIQAGLVSKNITFIEDQHYFYNEERSAYDKGLVNNWNEVMGSMRLLWMCRPNGNGMNYVRNDGLENDDISFV
ncbi:uncharacterized protein VNE69_03060 [Vairimorpha necatrix]|uniref:Palmitoyltransferase n=1 Tax=Vairimorpha necatrix TaxID=6039 RepID=A0AAX4JA31_9MICR